MITSNTILFTVILIFALQAIILSVLIIVKKPRKLADIFLAMLILFFAIMALNIVLVNVLKDRNMLYVFRYIQLEQLYGIGPALYFYTRCISNPSFKFQPKHWLHFIPLVLEFLFYRTSIYRLGSDGLYESPMPTLTYVYLAEQWLGIISILGYSLISLGLLVKHQKALKSYYSRLADRSLSWLQLPIIVYAGYFIFWTIITEIDRFVYNQSLREYYFLPTFVGLAIISCWIGFKGYTKKQQEVVQLTFTKPQKKSSTVIPDHEFKLKLEALMKLEKPYLNPDLDLAGLAKLLQMKPKQVSLKINQNFPNNFYELINTYRVEEFKLRLKSLDHEKLTLIGLAYECGFNSKSTFNHIFKKMTSLTPSEYLKKSQK